MSYNKCQAKSPGLSKYILVIKLPQKKRRQAGYKKTKEDAVVPTDVVKIRINNKKEKKMDARSLSELASAIS